VQQPINLNSTKNPLAHEETSHTNEEDIPSYFSPLMLFKIHNMHKQISNWVVQLNRNFLRKKNKNHEYTKGKKHEVKTN